MKKSIFAFWIIYGFLIPQRILAFDVAFVTNDVVVAAPVLMPVVGAKLDGGEVVLNLYGADTATRRACGYYPIRRFDYASVPSNKVVAARGWIVDGGEVVESVTLKDKPFRVALDRVKLARVAKENGWTEGFMNFVNSDPEIAVRWYSKEKLVAGSEEMRPFIEGFCAVVGITYEQALTLLEQCRED
jgi:hypothetical protein